MNAVYVSGTYDEDIYGALFQKEKKPAQASNKYHSLLYKGLAEDGVNVIALSSLPVSRVNCSKVLISIKSREKTNLKTKYLNFINFPVFKHVCVFLGAFFNILLLPRDFVVIYDYLTISASLGAVLAAKAGGRKTIAVVTDLPQFQCVANKKTTLKASNFLLSVPDGYVFITEQMNSAVNKENKPFIILEGFVDSKMKGIEHEDFDKCKRIVLYAGSLKEKYGIKNLCESFVRCAKPGEELHLFGDGDYVPEIKRLQEDNSQIFYHGVKSNSEIIKEEQKAVLLVNPRPTEGEYTKYSFPSKTMEYMASGTPVLTARLEGIPNEYQDYLLFFDDAITGDLETKIRTILDMNNGQLQRIGCRSRSFVLDNKTNDKQAQKVKLFMEYIN